ncbi:ABC transporter permease [Pararhodobacter sp.]|jgi:peptide/nickel transport system permease protein|uniref:ABC transporter permease n=1 Tax=Pararhodobacter sp. TaxID=2127056 RepID=UPI002FDE4AC8
MIAQAFTAVRRMRLNMLLGLIIVGAALLIAVFGPWISPADPLQINLRARLAPPQAGFLLGADEFGRDVLSRLIAGARTSVTIALITVFVAVVLGASIGVIAGYRRGWTDRILMVFNDAMLAFPGLLLALGIMAVFGASRNGIIVALGLAYAPVVVRVVRGSVLSIREREFIEASRVIGNSEWVTMRRHVLPNCLAPLLVVGTMMFGWVILAESALSFLGLGVPPPAPSWGNMLNTARPHIAQAPQLILFPGLCISITLLGVNMLGDAVRDWLDPKMEGVA